jgi:hypothetical protein
MNLERLTVRAASCSLLLLAGASMQLAAAEGRTRAAVFNDGDGTGKGELGVKLVKPPKDLTAIAKASGGEFPFWRVFDIIAGDTDVPGHETFHMPLYSQRMRGQEAAGLPPAHVRVLELTHYLESIQHK